jgi:hypothetical protein
MIFLHTKGHNPAIVARVTKRAVINGEVVTIEPPAVVQFSGARAIIEDSDPDYEAKVAACRKADWVVALGEAPQSKAAVSAEEPVAQSPLITGAPSEGGIAASGPPRLTVRKGSSVARSAPPMPTKADADAAKAEEM